MNARSARPSTSRRYRRRILGWGAVGVVGIFAVGGPIFVNRVEDDLEQRAVGVLNAAGVGPVAAHFSGQDGELRCADGPVDIPGEVVDAIANLWGVSSIEVAPSCAESATAVQPDDNATAGTDVSSSVTETADSGVEVPTAPDYDPVSEVVEFDSQFSTLADLLGDVSLNETLSGRGPYTMFAPTDAAFEALGPDVTGALARDSELLQTVLEHHVMAGTLLEADMVDGALDMLDGTTVTVEFSDGLFTIDSTAVLIELDLLASNGVVHAIDHVLLPAGLSIGVAPVVSAMRADLADGQLLLSGTVASEDHRAALIAAPGTNLEASNVLDQLEVDPAAVVTDDTIDSLATVIAAMTEHLVRGDVEVVDAIITVTGVFATEPDRAAFEAAVAAIDGDVLTSELTERPAADAGMAAELEADLNQLVADNPIRFDPSSTAISAASVATLDRVTAVVRRVGGITIVVEGHTDTDGAADSNQALSEGRARSVRDALIARGIAADTLNVVGFGGSEPILDAAGVEDKVASRRVEFVVSATE